MSETYSHHRFLHSSVIALMLGGVYYAGEFASGGYENVWQAATRAYHTSLGLKEFNLNDNTIAAETNAIGTATSECLGDAPYGTDTVHRTGQNPNTYTVYVRKMGAGVLNASAVEACIFDHTHLKTSVLEEK